MWLLIAFVVWPLAEIALFVEIGGRIGVPATLLWVVAGAMLGVAAVRGLGARTMAATIAAIEGLRDPARPIAEGTLGMLGAVLLILPGFLSDAVGLALLLPPVRAALVARLRRSRREDREGPVVIATDYRDVSPRDRRP